PVAARNGAGAREALERARIPRPLVQEILDEAERQRKAFAPGDPLAEHVRRALARRVQVHRDGRSGKRRIALVGPPGAGKTLAAAKLCCALERDGARVAALSFEPARRALELAAATEALEIELGVAESPEAVDAYRRTLRGKDVLVADTPAIDPDDPDCLLRLASLLEALAPTETHLVAPLGAGFEAL